MISIRPLPFLLIAATLPCVAQNLCSLPYESVGFKASPDEDAYSVLDRIAHVVPFQSRTIRLFPSTDAAVKQKGGAAAQLCGPGQTERWIFYDPTYIKGIARQSADLARYFVLAHEAAHHVNGDTLLPSGWSKDAELHADYSASAWLSRLGVEIDELLTTFDSLGLPSTSINGYPTAAERRSRVVSGYHDGRGFGAAPANEPMRPKAVPAATRGTGETYAVLLKSPKAFIDNRAIGEVRASISSVHIRIADANFEHQHDLDQHWSDQSLMLAAGTHAFEFEADVELRDGNSVKGVCKGFLQVNGPSVFSPYVKLSYSGIDKCELRPLK